MAEAEEGVVLIPGIAEVAQVELEVATRVRIHVRHPTIEVRARPRKLMYDMLSIYHQERRRPFFEFYSES